MVQAEETSIGEEALESSAKEGDIASSPENYSAIARGRFVMQCWRNL